MVENDLLFDLSALDNLISQDGQQFSGAPSTSDFQEFCQEFAKTGYEKVPEWASATDPLEQGQFDAAITDDRQCFNPHSSFKDFVSAEPGFHHMFNFCDSNDTQVVPDMAPSASPDSDLMAPTVGQLYRQADMPEIGLDPYSWMQGTGSLPFGYPTRPRSSKC